MDQGTFNRAIVNGMQWNRERVKRQEAFRLLKDRLLEYAGPDDPQTNKIIAHAEALMAGQL